MADFDITIIGGGINGTALARDAAGRGLRVLLLEQNDLASGTSWTSSKLIHGGLRYLEQGAFRLVQEGLHERETLLKTAPHIIWPARFILPHHEGLRPAWQLRIGLFIYDILAGANVLPGTRGVDLRNDETGHSLQQKYKAAFEYSDCCVDDARLVVLNALDAAERGATIYTRAKFERAERRNNQWHITFQMKNSRVTLTTRVLINASGPWIEQVNAVMPQEIPRVSVKMIKGSHIVVPRLFTHDKCYIFQNADGRIVFAIPYQTDFTMIGTTDVQISGDPAQAKISHEEINYLCAISNEYFQKPITPKDVVWSFAGVRALYDNRTLSNKDLSRDYFLALDGGMDRPPLLSVYGGKLTAARHLAEVALNDLNGYLPIGKAWTGTSPLPGGDFAWDGIETEITNAKIKWPFLSDAHARRLLRAYGTRISRVLGNATSMADLGIDLGETLTEAEVKYLMQVEWAQTADDILWLRSKLGLRFSPQQKDRLATFMAGTKA